jgi:hypothetical protein
MDMVGYFQVMGIIAAFCSYHGTCYFYFANAK